MNRLVININALCDNLKFLSEIMEKHGATWTVVTKALCGHEDTIKALSIMGTRSVADSRLKNLEVIEQITPDLEKWYLRLPQLSLIEDVIKLSDVSLNSEISVIKALSKEAVRQNKIHYILIMVELGDLREGILPGTLIKFYKTVLNLPNIKVLGLGAQLGCLSGVVPSPEQVDQMVIYREFLELKFQHKLPMLSAGSSILLAQLIEGDIPKGINHFRIGEALFLGTDLINGGVIKGLRDDVVLLEAEIAEIKEKSLIPLGETTHTPFETNSEEEDISPGQRGYRALVTVGHIDTDVTGLTPVNPNYQIAGASSDITVVNIGEDPDGLKVGDTISFHVDYSAFVRLMSGWYIPKDIVPSLDVFKSKLSKKWDLEIPPVIE